MLNSGALIKYDIRKERFRELVPLGVGALEALDGEIWCTVRDTLFRYDTDTDSLCFYRKLDVASVMCMEMSDRKIWIGTASGLYVMEGEEVKCVLPDIEIYKLFVSSRKELWIASRMQGLYKVGRDGKITKEEYSPERVVSQQIRGLWKMNGRMSGLGLLRDCRFIILIRIHIVSIVQIIIRDLWNINLFSLFIKTDKVLYGWALITWR